MRQTPCLLFPIQFRVCRVYRMSQGTPKSVSCRGKWKKSFLIMNRYQSSNLHTIVMRASCPFLIRSWNVTHSMKIATWLTVCYQRSSEAAGQRKLEQRHGRTVGWRWITEANGEGQKSICNQKSMTWTTSTYCSCAERRMPMIDACCVSRTYVVTSCKLQTSDDCYILRSSSIEASLCTACIMWFVICTYPEVSIDKHNW